MNIFKMGAQRLLQMALEAEVNEFVGRFETILDSSGKRAITRNGHLPERTIQTGIGDIAVKAPRAADRRKNGAKIRFTSSILPPYPKRTKNVEELLPWLYLKGISVRRWRPCWARTHQGYLRPQSVASRRYGVKSSRSGNNAR
jgi:putative transposase